MLPDFSNSDREISIITTFTLFPDGKPALSVAWTLTFELIFYLFYTLRFFGKQFFRIMLLFWIIIILIKNIFFGEFVFELNIFKTLTSLYNLEFFFGILLVYVYSKKIQIKNWISVMAIFLFGILFLVMIILKFDFFNFSINIAFVSFIFFFIYLTITKFNDTKNSNLFVGIGAASYSIYLIHNNLQTIIVRYFPKIMIEIRILLIILTSLLFSIIIGYVYYFIFEKRITNYFKKIIN
jgi:peptidoglycan/LPS O-acetylase OafA/YrhL